MLVVRPLCPDRPLKPVVRRVLLSVAVSLAVGSFAVAAVPVQLDSVSVRGYQILPDHSG